MGKEYYILEHLETTLICKSPALPKYASHWSTINKHTGRDLTCQLNSVLTSYCLLGKLATDLGLVTYIFFSFSLNTCVLFAKACNMDILLCFEIMFLLLCSSVLIQCFCQGSNSIYSDFQFSQRHDMSTKTSYIIMVHDNRI